MFAVEGDGLFVAVARLASLGSVDAALDVVAAGSDAAEQRAVNLE